MCCFALLYTAGQYKPVHLAEKGNSCSFRMEIKRTTQLKLTFPHSIIITLSIIITFYSPQNFLSSKKCTIL